MRPPVLERFRPRRVRLAGRPVPAGMPRAFPSVRRFLRDARGGATGIVAAAVTVMTVGGTALIGDHLWLVDQRDTLKSAAEAASIAATLELDRQLVSDSTVSDDDLKTALDTVAKRYVLFNLDHLAPDRLKQAKDTLKVALDIDRDERTVGVTASADLGGTLFSRGMPLLGGYKGPEASFASAGVVSEPSPVEVVLAIDISGSMRKDIKGAFDDETRIAIVKKAAKHLVDVVVPDEDNRVAVGLVPWHHHIRLDTDTAETWKDENWARYPTERRYDLPYHSCDTYTTEPCLNPPAAVEQALPATPPEDWQGCLTEDRLAAGDTLPGLPPAANLHDLPGNRAFVQSFYPRGAGFAYQCLDLEAPDAPADFQTQICYRRALSDTSTDVFSLEHGVWVDFNGGAQYIFVSEAQFMCQDSLTITPLSTDPDTVHDAVDALDAVGRYTYSALGVLWGHRLLLSSWKGALGSDTASHPVGSDAPDADKMRKAIVLLTDGEDTHCGHGNHDCADSPLGIARAAACTEAKKAGIEIFVVTAMHEDKVSTDLADGLRSCSSAADSEYPIGTKRHGVDYVFVNNNDEATLKATFDKIAKSLRTVRRTY